MKINLNWNTKFLIYQHCQLLCNYVKTGMRKPTYKYLIINAASRGFLKYEFALYCFITARNEVGARLYFHRRVWFCSQWGVPGPGGCHGPRGGSWGECAWSRGCAWSGGGAWSRGGAPGLRGSWWRPPETATAVGGTHPTGMYSCFKLIL